MQALAAMWSHVPNKGEQMVRYYGYYSPASRGISRGKRKMQDQDTLIPSILEPVEDPVHGGDGLSKEYRRNWARLIRKIYEVDPLTCPRCASQMRVISVIEAEPVESPSALSSGPKGLQVEREVIEKILKHLGLWERKARPPPKTNAPQPNVHIDKAARPPRPETGTGSGGATRLPVATLTIHYSKHGFLRIQCW
jgi:hypothetical protein